LHGPRNKKIQDIYKECTDTSYGHAVALTEITNKKHKPTSEKNLEGNKKCKCGSETHRGTTHKDSLHNPKRKQVQGDSTENIKKVTCSNNELGNDERLNESVTEVDNSSRQSSVKLTIIKNKCYIIIYTFLKKQPPQV